MESANVKPLNRILSLLHQKLSVEVDFEFQRLRGSAELSMSVQRSQLRRHMVTQSAVVLHLDCRDQVAVSDCFFNDHPLGHGESALLSHLDGLSRLEWPSTSESGVPNKRLPFPHRIYEHEKFRRKYTNASLQPALVIDLGRELETLLPPLDSGSSNSSDNVVQDDADDDDIVFTVRLDFFSSSAVPACMRSGFYFVGGSGSSASGCPFFYSNAAQPWFPCMANDLLNPNNRCSWDIQVTVPLVSSAFDAADNIVVANGDLLRQVVHPSDSAKKICFFHLSQAVSSAGVAIAAGPFVMLPLTGFPAYCRGWAFCPPGYEEALDHSSSFISKAMEFFSQFIGASFPFSTFKLVFMPEPLHDSIMVGCTVSVMSTRYLHDSRIIDETFESRIEIARSIALQWFGQYIFPKTWADNWLIVGLANYVTGLFVRRHFGNNEYRFRLKKDIEKCYQIDIDQPPLFLANASDVIILDDLSSESLIKLKAPLVIYMLEKFLGKNMMQKIINKTIVAAISGEMVTGLSTSHFLKSVKKISGKEPKPFADQWIFRSGTPKLIASYVLNRKKNIIELKIQQAEGRPLYVGNLTVRVHEPDGTFDHVVAVEERLHHFELLYHTKYKRQRQNKKSQLLEVKLEQERLERERVEGLLPPPGTEDAEYMVSTDPEISSEISKSEWKEVDEDGNEINVPISWMRLDPLMDLMVVIEFRQSDYMDAQQLAKDKDPVSQYDAVRRMSHHSNVRIAACLLKCLLDVRTFYRVRMEAAISLASGFSKSNTGPLRLNYLFLAFRKKYCVKGSLTSDNQIVPVRNDFHAFTEYYVQKSIPEALAMVRDTYGRTPINVLRFLLSLLKMNDNTGNSYSDHGYVASLIDALGHALISENGSKSNGQLNEEDSMLREEILSAAVSEVERLLFLETQVPSYRNTIALSCLRTILEFSLHHMVPVRLASFTLFSRFGNFEDVRCLAIDGLCLLGIRNTDVFEYLLSLLESDPSPSIRVFVAKRISVVMTLLLRHSKKLLAEQKPQQIARNVNVDVEDLSGGFEEQIIKRAKTSLDELESFRKTVFLSNEMMDRLCSDMTGVLVYDDRTRRALLALIETCYDPSEFDIHVPVELPKLKLMIKQEKPVAPVLPPPPKIKLSLSMLSNVIAAASPTPTPAADEGDGAILIVDDEPIVKMDLDNAVVEPQTKIEVVDDSMPAFTPVNGHAEYAPKEVSVVTLPVSTPAVQVPKPETTNVSTPAQPEEPMPKLPPVKLKFTFKAPSQPAVQDPPSIPQFDRKRALRTMDKLMSDPMAVFFNIPVDPILHGAEDYFDIIKRPMDFGTIRMNLEQKAYTDSMQFEQDVDQVFTNCFLYNSNPLADVYIGGKKIEKIWKKEWLNPSSKPRSKKVKLS